MAQIFIIRNTVKELAEISRIAAYQGGCGDWFHGGNPPANRSKKSKKK